MKTEQPKMQRATPPIAALSLAAAAISLSPAHAEGNSGPDILGVRTGMSPEQVYEALKNIDVTHRVTGGQVPIPALLGNKTAVYAMAPESRNSGGEENMSVWISLPPNAQQVWSVQRQFNNSIHTTLEQIVDSLRQKYGAETVSTMLQNHIDMFWIYDGKGHLAGISRPASTFKRIAATTDCSRFRRQHAGAPRLAGTGRCCIDILCGQWTAPDHRPK
jgi:hypothetical protein